MSAHADRSLSAVVRDIGGNVDRIVRVEMRLAIAEVRANVREAAAAIFLFAVAGICAALAVFFTLLSAQMALALVMPPWLAALAVAALIGGLAAMVAMVARARLPHALAVPAAAPASLLEPAHE